MIHNLYGSDSIIYVYKHISIVLFISYISYDVCTWYTVNQVLINVVSIICMSCNNVLSILFAGSIIFLYYRISYIQKHII